MMTMMMKTLRRHLTDHTRSKCGVKSADDERICDFSGPMTPRKWPPVRRRLTWPMKSSQLSRRRRRGGQLSEIVDRPGRALTQCRERHQLSPEHEMRKRRTRAVAAYTQLPVGRTVASIGGRRGQLSPPRTQQARAQNSLTKIIYRLIQNLYSLRFSGSISPTTEYF